MPETQEMRSLGRETPRDKEIVTHSSILAWEIPWTMEPGRLQPMLLQRVRQDLATKQLPHVYPNLREYFPESILILYFLSEG